MTVYLVTISQECSDDYYNDYEYNIGIFSSLENAIKEANKVCVELNVFNPDPHYIKTTGVFIDEWVLDTRIAKTIKTVSVEKSTNDNIIWEDCSYDHN